jgi:hypothetical protein
MGNFMKFDSEKPRYELVPPSAMAAMAKVLTYGAHKYEANNWRKVDDPDRYIAALYRHLELYRSGEATDTESGFSHLEHAITNLAFLIELDYVPKEWKNGSK